jgi:transitional endoplasmic reticulum ATPase
MDAAAPAQATSNPTRGTARFLLLAALLLVVYVVAVPLVFLNQHVVGSSGPLSHLRPEATATAPGAGIELAAARRACKEVSAVSSADDVKLVAAAIDGRPYFACYGLDSGGKISGAAVLDGDGRVVHDAALIKKTGAWRYIGTVKTSGELVLGGLAMVVIPGFAFLYYRRPRPGRADLPSFWQSSTADVAICFLGPLGWLALAFDKERSNARKVRLIMLSFLGFMVFVAITLLITAADYPDVLSYTVTGLIAGQGVVSLLMGRFQLAPPGFGLAPGAPLPSGPGQRSSAPTAPRPFSSPPARTGARPGGTSSPADPSYDDEDSGPPFKVRQPSELPSFSSVGGMTEVKTELLNSVGLLLAFGDEAEAYRLTFNGILLYGPPGTGKTFIAQATAGELGLRYLRVAVTDLVSKYVGDTAKNIERVFATAVANVPCLLFFDEFDSIAGRRDDDPNEENRRAVNQLLTSLEQYRALRELVVMAATNNIEQLDPAVIRPGRFDRRIRIDLPDATARRSILTAQLKDRPTDPTLDLDELVQRSDGLSAAAIASLVGDAALIAFRETTASGLQTPISTAHLLGALAARGGKDRPTIEKWSWDRLVLDPSTKAELRQLQTLVEDPHAAEAYGVQAPAGLLLTGPPGTGKTTIARVFAAEAKCSFYPITAADLTSMWVGESEANVARLFARARENAPSIVFIDEVDSIASERGSTDSFSDQLLNQLLAEIDGLKSGGRVFVVAATNRADVLDPALLRGGRLSRTMLIGLPGPVERTQLLTMFTGRMPLFEVSLDDLAAKTDGLSGADLEALCQQAAVAAMTGAQQGAPGTPRVTMHNFDSALATVHQARAARANPELSSFLDKLTTSPEPPSP